MKLGAQGDNNPSARSTMLRMLTPTTANCPDVPAPVIGCVGSALRVPVMDQARNVEALKFEVQADLAGRDTRPRNEVIEEAFAGMRGINKVNNTLEGAMKEQFFQKVKENRAQKLLNLENQYLTAEQKEAKIAEDLATLAKTIPAPLAKAADMAARKDAEASSFGDASSQLSGRELLARLAETPFLSYVPSAMSADMAESLREQGLYGEEDEFKTDDDFYQAIAEAEAEGRASTARQTTDPVGTTLTEDARERFQQLATQSPAMEAMAGGGMALEELKQLDEMIQSALISNREPNWNEIQPLMGALRSNRTGEPFTEVTAGKELRLLRAAFRRNEIEQGQQYNNLVNRTNLKDVAILG